MKKRILGLLLGVMLISVCVGCGAESTTTEPTETATETITEESTIEQTKEATATPEETAELEVSEVEETTETEAEEITTTDTETEAVEPEPTPTEEDTKITEMSATMYATQTVNVRSLPNAESDKLGSLSTNDEIQVTGQAENGWYRFEYNGNVAFVSNKYVGDKKVEVQQTPTANNNSGSGSASTSNTCPYPLWQPVDNGDSITWYVTQPDPNWENEHRATQAWMFRTIESRCSQGYWSDQTEWTFMGTYAEGNVYRQTIGIIEYNW